MSQSLDNLEKRKYHWFQYQDITTLISYVLTCVTMEDEIVYLLNIKFEKKNIYDILDLHALTAVLDKYLLCKLSAIPRIVP